MSTCEPIPDAASVREYEPIVRPVLALDQLALDGERADRQPRVEVQVHLDRPDELVTLTAGVLADGGHELAFERAPRNLRNVRSPLRRGRR